ncbi:MAG: type IV pilin, partial [Thermoplasmata archaeon]|nr:type IV pilin [Thermoplasmata archaeon]
VSQVGTILLVALALVLATVVGAFVMNLADFNEPPPTMEVVTSSQPDRMHAHIKNVGDARPISEFRLLARDDAGNMIIYDSDGDAVGDAIISIRLDELSVTSASGPMKHPLVFVDADGDGRVSSGDFITYRHPFFPPIAPFIDTTHGYKVVEMAPNGIHRDSTMLVVASPDVLPGSDLLPGDTVRVTIGKGGVIFYQVEGIAGIGGIWTTTIDIPMDWTPANYGDTRITVRPGEFDEWSLDYPFKVLPENPVSKAEQAYYERLNNPLVDGSRIALVHVPSNTVVIEFMA